MTDAQDLARRYLAVWEEYLTGLLCDPAGVERLWCWSLHDLAPHDAFAAGSTPGAPPAAGTSDKRGRTVAELTRRLALLEERVAALESSGQSPARPRRRNRRVRA